MAEGVGRVKDAHPTTESDAIGSSEEKIADQRFTGGNLLVSEDIPRPGFDPALRHQPADPLTLLRAHPEIVFQQDRLAIEQESGNTRFPFEQVHQVIDDRNKPRAKLAAREIPLTIPVSVRYEMEGKLGHITKVNGDG